MFWIRFASTNDGEFYIDVVSEKSQEYQTVGLIGKDR
jgi:hypothetical protein